MAVHSPVNGTTAIPWRSSRRKLSLLEKLRGCEEAWCPKEPWSREEARAAICGTAVGSFLVLRHSETRKPSLLFVSTPNQLNSVTEWDIDCSDTAFHLSGSRLCFSDLTQLVLFYSFTRDVLPLTLNLPNWVYDATDSKDFPSQLEPRMWLSEQQPDEETNKGPNTLMCSIQTSSNGAVCVFNPLYIHEHGDEFLTPRIHSKALTSPHRRERRLSTTRSWTGAGLHHKRAVSLDQESTAPVQDNTGLVRVRSADSKPAPAAPTAPSSGVVLRRPSRDSPSTVTLSTSTAASEHHPHSSSAPQSPHRVSWIEDGVWLSPPKPSSFLCMPSLELDSLSVSSIEEEQDALTPISSPCTASPHSLADKVKNRFSAVGQVLGGLVSQKKRLNNKVQELSERRGGAFAESVKAFVERFSEKSPEKDKLTEFLQEVRSALTSLRETLLDQAEIQALLDTMMDVSDAELDTLIERSLHKVTLKPLSCHLYGCIQTSRSGDGTLDRLMSNQPRLEPSDMKELGGSAGVGVPDSATLERIQQKWDDMHTAYSPNKKVQVLLKVCTSIYHSMSANANNTGAVFGADDFLPCLTWVLLRSDVITLQVDIDYMMELLEPTQLQGEGGYYLTTLYASLFYISSYKPRLVMRQLSVEAEQSLKQWHRRRTLFCDRPRRSVHRRTIRRTSRKERPGGDAEDALRELSEEKERNGVKGGEEEETQDSEAGNTRTESAEEQR